MPEEIRQGRPQATVPPGDAQTLMPYAAVFPDAVGSSEWAGAGPFPGQSAEQTYRDSQVEDLNKRVE